MVDRAVLAQALPAGQTVQASAELELEPRPRVVREAREFVAMHIPALSEQALDILALLTSELVTNAVIHARTPMVVGVAVTPSYVLVTVHDLDLGRREQDPYDRDGGRGLTLVGAMSDAHDLVVHPAGGKTAWFRLRRDDAAGAAR